MTDVKADLWRLALTATHTDAEHGVRQSRLVLGVERNTVVSVVGLECRYGPVRAVDGMDLQVGAGEVVACWVRTARARPR